MPKEMILRMPSYCKSFRCTADKCSDNCCIGWEIDVDEKSFKKYKSIDGEFGQKLCENIAPISVPHFILDKNERCPFLNENNLCEIYINLGEEALCEICTNHPRFFEWYDGIKEGGIGLCCEAAAEIIITCDEPFSYYDIKIPFEDCEEYDREFYSYLFEIRSRIIKHIRNAEIPFKQRLTDILFFAAECQNAYDNFNYEIPAIENNTTSSDNADLEKIFKEISSLEMLEESKLFEKAYNFFHDNKQENLKSSKTFEKSFENITIYFIWRHLLKSVYEGEFYSKIAFAVLSTSLIAYMLAIEKNEADFQKFKKICVYFSKEIEYSEQNLNRIFDKFYENNVFSISKISSLFKIF